MNPYFDEPFYREPGTTPPEPADLRDLGPVLDPFSQAPFYPDDPMDWAFGISFVAVPYAVSYLVGGPAGLTAYSLVGPDILLFAAGVLISNFIQAFPPRASIHARAEVEQSILATNPFYGVPGYV